MNVLYFILANGVFQICMALIINVTGDRFTGRLIFKVIPFFAGLMLIAYASKQLGWL